MKFYKDKNQLLIVFLAVGFFVGILYENIVSKNHGITMDIFQSYFLEQYKDTKVISEEYLWYVVRARIVPLLILCVLGCMKWKKVLVSAALLWTGFLTGIMLVSAVMQLGIKGVLICLTGLFPHMICYGMAYGVLLLYLYHYPHRLWNGAKTIFIILFMFLGIILEAYLNPILIKLVI